MAASDRLKHLVTHPIVLRQLQTLPPSKSTLLSLAYLRNLHKYDPERVAEYRRRDRAKRPRQQSQIRRRTPAWANSERIAAIYALAREMSKDGQAFHVDHIVPLRGTTVSGLHVESNLRICAAHENMRKGNRMRKALLSAIPSP